MWFFLWAFQTLKYVPSTVFGINGELLVVGALGCAALALLLFPFLVADTPRSRRAVVVAVAAALTYMVLMTALALHGQGGPTP